MKAFIDEMKLFHDSHNPFDTVGERRAFTAIFCLSVAGILLFMSPVIIAQSVKHYLAMRWLRLRCRWALWQCRRVMKDRGCSIYITTRKDESSK